MKITIITVCYNASSTIAEAIASVAIQRNVVVEHIVIDGASTDDTVQIVNRYPSVSKFISEPDKGLYDAMNKGIKLATGDIIGTLNADDFYVRDNVLEQVLQSFSATGADACFGDLLYVNRLNTTHVIRYWKSKNYVTGLFKFGWMPAHPTFFARKDVYERFGVFDLNYKIAADFELLFRLIEKNKIKTYYMPKVLVKMRLGGKTNKNIKNILIQNKEIICILRNYYTDFSLPEFIYSKLSNRLLQFLNRPNS